MLSLYVPTLPAEIIRSKIMITIKSGPHLELTVRHERGGEQSCEGAKSVFVPNLFVVKLRTGGEDLVLLLGRHQQLVVPGTHVGMGLQP